MTIHTRHQTLRPGCVALAIAANAALHAAQPALRQHGEAMRYGEFAQGSARLAGALRAAGVSRGEVVAVLCPRGPQPILAQFAAWRLGAAYLPLDPDWPQARIAALIARAGAKAVVAAPHIAAPVANGVVVVDPAATAGITPYDRVEAGPDDLAYVIFTSGSSGEPKGVAVTHANLAALVEWHIGAFSLHPGMVASHIAGLAFDAAAWEVWPVLASAGTLAIPPEETIRYDAERLAGWLVDERVEIGFAPTATAEALIARAWPANTSLRNLLTGADRLKARPPGDLPFALVNNYGPTECTVVATSGVVSAQGADHSGGLPGIGRPIAGTKVYLLDANGNEVPDGAEGEIWIGGAGVARGYFNAPDLTAERFIKHPHWGRLYRSGDLARRDAAGELHFLGRLDAQIKLRGHRIEPAEIEAALAQCDGVAAAAAALRDDELVGYLVPREGAALSAHALRESLAASLPAMMVPARFAVLGALPLTSNGKLDRAALPNPASCALAESVGRGPSTPTEARLTSIVGEVIGRKDFSVDDDFFLLGGHSLLGTQVIVRARDAFGVELTLLHLFEARTVAALAARVEELAAAHLATLSDADIARMLEG